MTIDRSKPAVKPKRSYNSRGRQDRARQMQESIVETAHQLFLQDGYSATTVAAIGETAGVSVETIYKAFGGKPGLVRAIVNRGLEGEGPVPAAQRSDHIRETEPNARKILAAWGRFVTELAPRTAPILRLARDAAAADPDMENVLQDINQQRLERMRLNARRLHEAGHLRPGLNAREAADILWTYSSPELYELLVQQRGWSPQRFGTFVGDAMIAALLPGLA